MTDDLFERLRGVDPATDERIAEESRALGNTPARIVESEPSNVRRFPKAARRKATLVAVAAVVVVAIALPLTLLRSLGEGGGSPGDNPGNWVTVGTLSDIQSQGIVYVPGLTAFVVAKGGSDAYALFAGTWNGTSEDISVATGQAGVTVAGWRALYCEPSQRFVDLAGNVFDEQGRPATGTTTGLARLAVRTVDGNIQVEPLQVSAAVIPDSLGGISAPQDLGCLTTNGVPLEGKPGFAIPNGTELPPISVAIPQAGAFVQSPITIAGSANVFEATVSIRVLDANGDVIAESFATATCGTGCRGDFSTQVDIPIDAEQPATIQVFESSAKDGSMINTVEIPVTLVPGTAAATESVEGTWVDGNGVPLPDGSPDAAGTVLFVFRGAEHCQWQSVTFMHIGWPVGTVSNYPDQWRQYVRDPEGLFDDGALHVGYLSDTSLPSDAADTGYQRGPWRLWVSPSQADDAIFVVNTDTGAVERWGRSTPPILCD
jgi:immunoglobulin-like protein involved in spore germination